MQLQLVDLCERALWARAVEQWIMIGAHHCKVWQNGELMRADLPPKHGFLFCDALSNDAKAIAVGEWKRAERARHWVIWHRNIYIAVECNQSMITTQVIN